MNLSTQPIEKHLVEAVWNIHGSLNSLSGIAYNLNDELLGDALELACRIVMIDNPVDTYPPDELRAELEALIERVTK